jgi:hypothetical protein
MANHFINEAVAKRLLEGHVREKLIELERNPLLNTRPSSYSANSAVYPSGQIPFVEKHMAYLMAHPKLDHDQYIANLRLMLKTRN